MPEEKNKQTNKQGSIWGWIFGTLFLVVALFAIFSSFLAGLVLMVSAVFFFPPAAKGVRKKLGIELTKKYKIIVGVVGVILFFILIGGGDTETTEIKIEKGESQPEEMVEAGQLLTNVVSDFQDAQLSTVALLAVKFETADEDDYLEYIKEVEDKWEKVKRSAEKLEKMKTTDTFPALQTSFQWINSAQAEYPETIEFNEAMKGGFDEGTNEYSFKNDAPPSDPFEDARFHKHLAPGNTIIGYLMDHFKITAEEAQRELEKHYGVVGKEWNDSAALYNSASKTAQGIAYGSKVSLYVLGTVASFGAAAAAETGTGVILGYMGGAWGAAIGGADIALDVAEGATVVSTGKGLTNYKKDKEMLGKMNNTLIIFNVAKFGATGIPKFDGNSFQKADDFMSYFTPLEAGANYYLNAGEESVKAEWGKRVKFPKGTPIRKILKAYHKEGFEYNKVALMIGQNEKGEIVAKEVDVANNDDSCQPDRDTIDAGSGKLIQEEYWWPACEQSVFSKPSCNHLPNTCLFQGRCVCKEGHKPTTNEDKKAAVCITDEEQMFLLGDQLARVSKNQCDKLGMDDHPGCASGAGSYKKSAEVEELEKKLEKFEGASRKAWNCDL